MHSFQAKDMAGHVNTCTRSLTIVIKYSHQSAVDESQYRGLGLYVLESQVRKKKKKREDVIIELYYSFNNTLCMCICGEPNTGSILLTVHSLL